MRCQDGLPLANDVVKKACRRFHVVPVQFDELFELRFKKLLQEDCRLVNMLFFIIVQDGIVKHKADIMVELRQSQVVP